jgi:Abortive infection C-terminus
METWLSPRTIDALVEVISGGSGMNQERLPIGKYRSGPELERFMRQCNIEFRVQGSRLPSLADKLIELNKDWEAKAKLTPVIEAVASPLDFFDNPEKGANVIAYLNQFLAYDGLELQRQGQRIQLLKAGSSTPVVSHLADLAEVISFDTVQRDLDRALGSIQTYPEDSITAACSTIESVCRSILVELGEPLPSKKDVQGLYNAVKKPLGLSPDRTDVDAQIADDVRKVLSGLATTIEGIGALRTHAGDAHGRERGHSRVDERIARLAIHSATTVSLFLIETWQKKFPTRTLIKK